MSDGRDANQLFQRVEALMKRHHEDVQRAVEEVPLLTEIVDKEAQAATGAAASEDELLAADIERVVIVRLVPELNRQIAGLRSELEKELRRAVREAVAHALTARKTRPDRS